MFKTITPCPLHALLKILPPSILYAYINYWMAAIMHTWSPLFSRQNNPNPLIFYSQKFCRPLTISVVLICCSYNTSISFLCLGTQSWMQYSRWCLRRVEYRERITFPELLSTLLLMQPRIWSTFCTESTNAGSYSVFYPRLPPSPPLQGCSQSTHSTASIYVWDYLDTVTGPFT